MLRPEIEAAVDAPAIVFDEIARGLPTCEAVGSMWSHWQQQRQTVLGAALWSRMPISDQPTRPKICF